MAVKAGAIMAEFIKQNVQWFPGHMAKTRRLIKESLNLVDGVVEILDARVPYSSQNPELDGIIKNKPRIILLNKCDVANANATNMWIKYFESKGAYALPVDCKTGRGLNKFDETVKLALSETIEKNESKGMSGKPLRLMVVGIPNTGKSSFINRMGKMLRLRLPIRQESLDIINGLLWATALNFLIPRAFCGQSLMTPRLGTNLHL